jgi:hypothetical protein
VNGYELIEQALTKKLKAQTIPVRPFGAEHVRHVVHRQRIAPNFVLPVITAD